ncbi:MAG: single-stranded-DNA-specific exonuclease RecJ [Gammaproteobacteria bacterium]|nr:single-stranded-DNA-specific exonuclease RecJ [Gammaproteobacteria bacterium]
MKIKKTLKRRNVTSDQKPENIDPVLWRVYQARGINDLAEVNYELSGLLSHKLLLGIDTAVELLSQAVQQQQKIIIVGDYDVDGATSTALAVRLLKAMGLASVSYLVPSRFTQGYGLTPAIIAIAQPQKPDLLITVDNGIASIEGVAAANAAGIKVLVTDHHLPGAELPKAAAIVNPNQHGDNFPSKNMAGVGVIFYVLAALRAQLREEGWFEQQGIKVPNMGAYLDLVALGTVADVVPLDKNNRLLVRQGLARINANQCVPGIRALVKVANRNIGNLVASDMGFSLGPRLNAAGRLDDMALGIECLLTDDEDAALEMAMQLDALNKQRRTIEWDMQQQATEMVAEITQGLDKAAMKSAMPGALVLFNPKWHQGVIGILASRIKESTYRPVIAFASGDENEIKGSARSIQGLHIRDALEMVSAKHPGLIKKFGGHAMAAGLTLARQDLEKFQQAFTSAVESMLSPEDLQAVLFSDGELPAESFSLQTAEVLRDGGPWGQGFPEPIFDGVFMLVEHRVVGEKHLKMVLQVSGSERYIDAIAFNTTHKDWGFLPDKLHLVYKLDVNEYRDRRNVQLIVEQVEPLA